MRKFYDVIVVGSGAAGFSTADWLHSFGIKNICIVTEGINCGTSRNTGSDKQTYYKLDMCSDAGDSVLKMAQDMCAGGGMNGSDAFIEAANSARCFMRLAELGVPFPTDRFGRFAGYRTDHDNTCRATSAGPLTSKYMTEKLQKKVEKNGTPILDGYRVIKLIVNSNKCSGVICHTKNGFEFIYSKAVILCTGAPAKIYSHSVYPESQVGATGLAIEAGAELSNFQEWQYGIASVKFRWNLSGSYQQVIPRYFSVDADGKETEFLASNNNLGDVYSNVFLKGYQWPFDSKKINGSSKIDLLVFKELEKGKRVFLDYTKNPKGFQFENLSDEAKEYLLETECLADTPIERLMKLNPKAVKLYKDNGIDLTAEPLEIRISAQHNNGGIRTNLNSETTVKNLFAAGEAAGKFGVYRPGGSALNDTQVGGLRAAEYLSKIIESIDTETPDVEAPKLPKISENPTLKKYESELSLKMSICAGIFRDYDAVRNLLTELES
ncbi:MAG: FAD-binding protein, partial [Clostridia bacterium]|nr:FAD-binding protein [Clostridia bacterium]